MSILPLLGLFCVIPGLIGFVMAGRELKRIDAGEAPLAGRFLARNARLLGFMSLLWLLASLILGLVAGAAAMASER